MASVVGNRDAPVPPASSGLVRASRSATVLAALKRASSTVTWNASSSAIISSTRSSELSPSASIVVVGAERASWREALEDRGDGASLRAARRLLPVLFAGKP